MKKPTTEIKQMPKNKRMANLIKNLANLEAADYDRLSSDGKKSLGKIWNLLGMPSQEALNKDKNNEKKD
jgi:hypothetical protein